MTVKIEVPAIQPEDVGYPVACDHHIGLDRLERIPEFAALSKATKKAVLEDIGFAVTSVVSTFVPRKAVRWSVEA